MDQEPVIGLDLGVTTPSELAVATGARIESTRRVASTPKGLIAGLRGAAKGRAVAIVVESTAMAWFLAAVAAARAGITHSVYRVSGSKAAALRGFYRAHTKTDHIDARVLARMPVVDEGLRRFTLPEPPELALRRLVVLRHKLVTEATRVQNRIRSTLHWSAPGMVQAAGGSVSAGLVAVLGRWSDLRALARARSATIARAGSWTPERAQAVRAAAAEAVGFYDGHVDFAHLALELDVAVAHLGSLDAQRTRLEGRIARLHEELHPHDHLLTVPGIGPVVAGVIRAILGTGHRFASLAA
jgi:Transposase